MKQKEDFERFMSQLKETNASLDFFCDFEKISRNVRQIAMKLNQLNYLIGQYDMETAVNELWRENPSVFNVLDILIAVRTSDGKKAINRRGEVQMIQRFFDSPEGVLEYLNDTGLQMLFQNRQVTNLVDFVFGVETGLDTNARKNRSGHIMENTVAAILRSEKIPYKQEVYSTDYPPLYVLGEDIKRFDFVITTKTTTYLVEVNFYSGGGSKLNEVARAYSELAPKINAVKGFEFVWITDGQGWLSAKNKLEEAFYVIPKVFNLTTIYDFVKTIKLEL
ncbi:MAG: type II restriction endonuclease [Fibrobacter sp.]|uniref:type II restriction endonuclease n=1 Tax=Fibrobacter sp. TaxID=35828 RepID=UPI0025BB7DFF|nr:type II restriction endonuclease [Fibrobacter sp.]MBQ7081261.1 type II restriction endonuclease [Fibrobacter sp.]